MRTSTILSLSILALTLSTSAAHAAGIFGNSMPHADGGGGVGYSTIDSSRSFGAGTNIVGGGGGGTIGRPTPPVVELPRPVVVPSVTNGYAGSSLSGSNNSSRATFGGGGNVHPQVPSILTGATGVGAPMSSAPAPVIQKDIKSTFTDPARPQVLPAVPQAGLDPVQPGAPHGPGGSVGTRPDFGENPTYVTGSMAGPGAPIICVFNCGPGGEGRPMDFNKTYANTSH